MATLSVVMDSLMVSQSVEFLTEDQSICNRLFVDVAPTPIEFVQQCTLTAEGERCIRMYESAWLSAKSLLILHKLF